MVGTVALIVKEVLLHWKRDKHIPFAITDNGSSMIKVFKDVQEMFAEKQVKLQLH